MNPHLKKLIIGNFSLKRIIRSIILSFILFYLFLIFIAYFLSDKIIFPIPKTSYSNKNYPLKINDLDASMQGINQKNNIASTLSDKKSNPLVGPLVGLKLENGNKIIIREIDVENPKFHIIYNHGNGVDLSIIEPKLQNIASILNCSVISYDYPGYGRSEGSPSEISVYSAITCIYNHLITHGVPKDKIVIWGRSIGGGPATFIAEKKKIAGLILESAFTSAFRVVTKIKILPFDKFPNIDLIENINAPLLIMHGKRDKVISFDHGKKLYSKAKEPKTALWVENSGHNDLEWVANKQYWDTLKKFLTTIQ
jgi:abhydrolase domain-containing protein 17